MKYEILFSILCSFVNQQTAWKLFFTFMEQNHTSTVKDVMQTDMVNNKYKTTRKVESHKQSYIQNKLKK